jgi:hypothetical protein
VDPIDPSMPVMAGDAALDDNPSRQEMGRGHRRQEIVMDGALPPIGLLGMYVVRRFIAWVDRVSG